MPPHTDPDVQDITRSTHADQYGNTYIMAIGREDDIARMHFSKTDFVTALRGNLPQGALKGSATFHDLLASDLSLNRHYGKKEIKNIYNKTTEEQREAAFPRQQLCEYMGITEETYRAIDVDNKRRDSFVLLQTLFKNASSKWKIWSKNKVPHILLIEELVNTFNRECIGKFLYDAAIVAVARDANVKEVSWIDRNTLPKEKRLFVSCTDPNRITVRIEYTLYPWADTHLGIKMRVEYDVAVVEDRLISYQDVCPTITFSTTREGDEKWQRVRSSALSSRDIIDRGNLPPHPKKYKGYWCYMNKAAGHFITLGMEGKTFTAQSMLAATPQEAQLPEEQKHGFFAGVVSGLLKLFNTIKCALFGHATNIEKEPSAEESLVRETAPKTDDTTTTGEVKLTPEHTTSPQEQQAQQTGPEAEQDSMEAVDQPCATVASATVSTVGSSNIASAK